VGGETPPLLCFGAPSLAHWEPAIGNLLGLASQQMLADEVAAVLVRAGVRLEGPGAAWSLRARAGRLRCGRRRALIERDEDQLRVIAMAPDDHSQQLVIVPLAAERAAIVAQMLVHTPFALPQRPVGAPARAAVRFGSELLAARADAIAATLGCPSVTAWLADVIAAHDLRVVADAGVAHWSTGDGRRDAVHAGRTVQLSRHPTGCALEVTADVGDGSRVGVALQPTSDGDAVVFSELWEAIDWT
jgi:hypothetical protein